MQQDLDDLYARDRARGASTWTAHRRYLRHLFASAFSLYRAAMPKVPRAQWRDLRLTLRTLSRAPWFSGACLGTVALSIALASTVFAIVDGVLFKPLPFPNANELALLGRAEGNPTRRGASFTAADLDAWRQADERLAISAFVINFGIGPIAGEEVTPDTTWAALVDRAFFDVVGMRPLVGGFSEGDYRRPFAGGQLSAHPAVISHRLWRRVQPQGGLRRDLIHVGDGTIQVVGVLSPDFVFPSAFARTVPDVLLPFTVTADRRNLQGILRRPAEVSVTMIADRLRGAVIEPVDAALGLRERHTFRMVFSAVILIVMLASLNVAALLAARGRDRASELAVRAALGASTGRLIQLMLLEALTLAVIGATLGVVAARSLLGLALALLPTGYLLVKPPAIDLRVVAFAMLSSTMTLMAFATWPAVRAARSVVFRGIREHGSTPSSARFWRRLALTGQSALGLLVVLSGTLLVAGFTRLWREDVGFERAGRALVEVTARAIQDSARHVAALDDAVKIASGVPGVEDVSSLSGPFLRNAIAGSAFATPPDASDVIVQDIPVAGRFFETAGIRLVSGRFPTREELEGGRPIAVVSDTVARAFWPDREPLGQVLSGRDASIIVVGVVADIRVVGLEERQKTAEIYFPMRLAGAQRDRVLLIRTTDDGNQVARRAAAAIARERPDLIVTRAESMNTALSTTVKARQFQSLAFGVFAAATIALLAVGTFGIVAMHTAGRRREIGVRIALGASAPGVRRLILFESLLPVFAGVVFGSVVASWTTGLLGSLVYGVGPYDLRLWAAAAACVVGTAALAAWAPALRASRIDPQTVLRTQ